MALPKRLLIPAFFGLGLAFSVVGACNSDQPMTPPVSPVDPGGTTVAAPVSQGKSPAPTNKFRAAGNKASPE